jgi:type II secretory pathway pseudopilin PulG
MPAAVPIALAVAAASTVYQAVDANQQRQHAKGAAQAQQTAMDAQIKAQDDQDKATKNAKGREANAGQAQALAAIRAAMSTSGMSGTVLSGPSSAPAPTSTKTLLGQ